MFYEHRKIPLPVNIRLWDSVNQEINKSLYNRDYYFLGENNIQKDMHGHSCKARCWLWNLGILNKFSALHSRFDRPGTDENEHGTHSLLDKLSVSRLIRVSLKCMFY